MANYLSLAILLFIAGELLAATDYSKLFWTYSLASKHDIEAFLTGKARVAKEFISYNTVLNAPVMGKSGSNTLMLADVMTTLKASRDEHELRLVIPTADTLNSSMIEILRHGKVDWLTLHFECFRGPNGEDPTIAAVELTDYIPSLMASYHFSFSLTQSKDDSVKGFSQAYMEKLAKDWTIVVGLLHEFDFQTDIFHISHTDEVLREQMMKQMNKVRRQVMFTNEKFQDKVNMESYKKFMEKQDMESCYFDVPQKFRNAFFKPVVVPTLPTNGGNTGWTVEPYMYVTSGIFFGRNGLGFVILLAVLCL